jgi:hypothetical protein
MTGIWGIGRELKATLVLVEPAFLFGGSMDQGFERRKGHWVVIAQKRRNVEAARGHGRWRKETRNSTTNTNC